MTTYSTVLLLNFSTAKRAVMTKPNLRPAQSYLKERWQILGQGSCLQFNTRVPSIGPQSSHMKEAQKVNPQGLDVDSFMCIYTGSVQLWRQVPSHTHSQTHSSAVVQSSQDGNESPALSSLLQSSFKHSKALVTIFKQNKTCGQYRLWCCNFTQNESVFYYCIIKNLEPSQGLVWCLVINNQSFPDNAEFLCDCCRQRYLIMLHVFLKQMQDIYAISRDEIVGVWKNCD